MGIRSFQDLKCWQVAREIRQEIRSLVQTLPPHEKYQLTSQRVRASRSVTNNIAEGYGRFHYKENIQFCRQARGSYYELIDDLTIAFEEEYIEEERMTTLISKIEEGLKILNGYINYLKQDNQVKEDEVVYQTNY